MKNALKKLLYALRLTKTSPDGSQRVKVEKKVEVMDKQIEAVKDSISKESNKAVEKLSRVQRQLRDLEALIVKQ